MKIFYFLLCVFFIGSCGSGPENKYNFPLKEAQVKDLYRIAYNVYLPSDAEHPDYEVFSMKLDGSDSRNLTRDPDVAWTYLATKDRILFISDKDSCYRCFYLYEMNGDGSSKRKITDFQVKDSWMGARKEGRELIVTPAKDSAFYIIDRSGKILSRLAVELPYINDPTFSPDGKQIAFRGARAAFGENTGYRDELYIMNEDGTDLQQLTNYPEADTTAKWHNYHAGPPRWHPSGEFISFQSKQKGKSSLYAVSPEGGTPRRLTDIEINEGWHDWSPDGELLALEVYDDDFQQSHIVLIHHPTMRMDTLTDTVYRFQQAPVFVRE